MIRYAQRQPASTLGLSALITGTICVFYLAFILPSPIIIIVALMLLLVLAFFSSMKVSVDQTNLRLSFGVGLIKFNIPLAYVASVKTVRNKWWYGWGIHLTPHGWLFNVAGLEAVELTMTTGKKYRIGTAEPELLARVIESHESVMALNSRHRLSHPATPKLS